jgi:hypothetical protein
MEKTQLRSVVHTPGNVRQRQNLSLTIVVLQSRTLSKTGVTNIVTNLKVSITITPEAVN